MATTPPALGYGTRGEAPIDAVNQWMRSTPWYQSLIRSFGQQPNSVHLNDQQKQQVIRAAQANGVVVDEGGNGQEIDDSGNFQAKGHKLRNTLIVAGVAAAAIATMGAAGVFSGAAAGGSAAAGALPAGVTLEGTAAGLGGASTAIGAGGVAGGVEAGAAAGLGAAALPGAGTALGVGATAAGEGAFDAAGNFIGSSYLSGGAPTAATGLSYADMLKYGLPVAGNLIGGVIQAKASGAASDAQQKYLEEALAYQKEQDAFNRARQTGLDAQERQRYGDYQGRIKGFVDNGQNSNDRMSALLGLAPRANVGSSAGASSGPPASQRVATDPATQAAIRSELQRTNSSDSPAAWDEYLASHGDSSVKNWDYWKNRIDTGDGVGKGYAGATGPSTGVAAPAVTTQPVTTQPVQMRAPDGSTQSVPADQVAHYTAKGATPVSAGGAGSVQMRGPDGSVKSVPADQVDHYRSLGATLLGAAA